MNMTESCKHVMVNQATHCVVMRQGTSLELDVQTLSKRLLQLSYSYEGLVYILELPDSLLLPLLRCSHEFHGLAKAAGVKLQLLCSGGPTTTQVSSS